MPYKKFSLQLFGEEGDTAGSDLGSTGGVAAATAENPTADGLAAGGEGEQAAPAQGEQAPVESWDDLIAGKYKKEYNQSVKAAIEKRFKNQRDLQGQIDSIDPMIRALATRYEIEANPDGSIPIDALTAKVMDDNSMYEQEAFQRGMSVQDLKQMKRLEAENAQLRRTNERTQQQREWDEITQQGENLKQLYPNFDLDMEMANPMFGRLLATMQKTGLKDAVRVAYETVHRDEIMGGAMQYAVKKTEQKISNSIQSGMRRPTENGTQQQSAAATGEFDPSKLTKAQIDDFKRRAERGERIVF